MEIPLLPNRIFYDREEPNGDRVNQYFKLYTVRTVLKALRPSELEIIKPCFGKILDVYSKPVYSGKLVHFLLTRQLDITKRHEMWFIFAGKPIRFSLREFGIVTGLDCSPLPPLDTNLVKSPPGVTPYWFTLFGGEEFVTAEMLMSKLRKPKSLTSEMRIKFACLLLVDGLLCRRSFHMKIPKQHVEMIRDIDAFFKYPWGRYSYDMTMQCIKSRTVNQLAQPTVAIRGFIHALQLVFIEAVPSLMVAVGDGTDPESGVEDQFPVISLKLDKVWDLDMEEEVEVISVISSPGESEVVSDFSWSDEVQDERVDSIVELYSQGIQFSRDMFVGGRRRAAAHIAPHARIVRSFKRKGKDKVSSDSSSIGETSKSKKTRTQKKPIHGEQPLSKAEILAFVAEQIQAGLKAREANVYEDIRLDLVDMECRITRNIKNVIPKMVDECVKTNEALDNVMKDISGYDGNIKNRGSGIQDGVRGPVSEKVNEAEIMQGYKPANDGIYVEELISNEEVGDGSGNTHVEAAGSGDTNGDELPTRVTVDESHTMLEEADPSDTATTDKLPVDPPLNVKFSWLAANVDAARNFVFAPGIILKDEDLVKLPHSIPPDHPQVMDSCVLVLRDTLFSNIDPEADHRAEFLTSKFPVALSTFFSRFKRSARKEMFEFDNDLVDYVKERCKATGKQWLDDIDFLYFPFNIDRKRWLCVMVDLLSHSLTVFDSSANVRRGSRLKPEIDFICEMFPYLMRKVAGNEKMETFSLEPLVFSRNTHVAQASDMSKTGMLTLMFMEAHGIGGLEKVYLVKEDGVGARAEQLAVEMYEHCCGEIE